MAQELSPKMNSKKRRQRVNPLFHRRLHNLVFLWQSANDRDWSSIVPVGREFGSPDYKRLTQQDMIELKINLAAIVASGQNAAMDKNEPEDSDEYSDALNVQSALRKLGHEVSVRLPHLSGGFTPGRSEPIG